ncbi:hypothetical protein GCM10022247_50060 [Allokutzneria multivorans]|uniref:Uncharacterized protein n=1 Tax=Allokutzneria multivorans TaxID=1142134 RepID=A0ABP7T2H5_9PSEU
MLLTEYRRGAGPLLTLTVAALVWLRLFGLVLRFPGSWLDSATEVLTAPIAPLVFTAAVWQASRERRRDMDDQLGSSARAAWRRRGLTWASIVLGGALGVALVVGVAVVLLVARGAYAAPGWWWPLIITVLGIGADAALGVLVGVVFPWPLLGIVLGVAAYVVLSEGRGPFRWWPPFDGYWTPDAGPHSLIALTLGIGVLALITLASRHRMALLAVPSALVCQMFLDDTTSFWRVDPRAGELVCRESVCTSRASVHTLDTVFAIAKPLLDKVAGIPGAPTTAAPSNTGASLWVTGMHTGWDGKQLFEPESPRYKRLLVQTVVTARCAAHDELSAAASAWWTGVVSSPQEQAALARVERLSPEAQRTWFGDYLSALRRCDAAALAALR